MSDSRELVGQESQGRGGWFGLLKADPDRDVRQPARAMYDVTEERISNGGGNKKLGEENFPDPIKSQGQSCDQVGEALGVSGFSVARANKVMIDDIRESAEAVDNGKVTVSRTTTNSVRGGQERSQTRGHAPTPG